MTGTACHRPSRLAEELPRSRRQDRYVGDRKGIRLFHKGAQGHSDSTDQPTCTLYLSDGVSEQKTDISVTDCGKDSLAGGCVQRGLSRAAGDPGQGPPVRPGEGQRAEAGAEAVRRIDESSGHADGKGCGRWEMHCMEDPNRTCTKEVILSRCLRNAIAHNAQSPLPARCVAVWRSLTQDVPDRGAASVERHGCGEAGDLLLVFGNDVGEFGVAPGRELLGQVHLLCELHLPLVERALEVYFVDRVAQVGGLAHDGDDAVLDLQVDLCAGLDVLLEVARGGDGEGGAAAELG